MKKIIYLLVIELLCISVVRSQGLTNKGSYIKISDGAVLKVEGAGGNLENDKNGNMNGEIQNNGKIYLQGNLINNADPEKFFNNRSGSGEIIFNGNSAQTISGTSTAYIQNLTVNQTGGVSPHITLGVNTVIMKKLRMIAGNIDLAGYTLTLGTAANDPGELSHSGIAVSGWIYGGNFIRYFNTTSIADRNVAGLFPVGSQVDFRPMYISYPSAALTIGGAITIVPMSAATASNVNFDDNGITVVRRNDSYWTVSANAGISVAGNLFNLSVEGTGFGLVNDVSDLRLTLAGSVIGTDGAHAGTNLNPQINRTGLSLAELSNNFYTASVNISSPMPVELISFDAGCNGDKIILNWTTSSETNNDYFTIERSADGTTFEALATVNAAGSSNSLNNYGFNDIDPVNGINYYKLMQTDFDGITKDVGLTWCNLITTISIEDPIISYSEVEETIHISINSSKEQLIRVSIYDLNGNKLFSENLEIIEGMNQSSIKPMLVSGGLYIVKVDMSKQYFCSKLNIL
jgi:hypothetical protein